jgi:putative acetyltransferase
MALVIREVDPTSPVIRPLIDAHLAFSHAVTPLESSHAMAPDALRGPGITVWAMFDADRPVAICALKRVDDVMAELKSMHVAQEARGRGMAARMLRHVEDTARDDGVREITLETGSDLLPAFDAARRLYERAGYAPCGPIAGYTADPMSAFFRRTL